MWKTAFSISMGNFRRAALAAVSLMLVMLLQVEIQARMASWVIVRTCVQLHVLFAGASVGAGFVRMPRSTICCNQRGCGYLAGWLGFGRAFCLTCNELCISPSSAFGSICSVGGSRPKRFLAMLGVTFGCTLEAHAGIALKCCYCAFLVIPAREVVLCAFLGPLPCVGVCCSPLRPCEIYFRGCQAI
jgi:hypothetical protein